MKRIKLFFSATVAFIVDTLMFGLWKVAQHCNRNFSYSIIPSLAELQRYNVNRPDQVEAVRSSLYDFQTYAQAGQTSLQFFQVPKGQSSKTLADTNMTSAGALPAPQSFLVQSIEIYFYPLNAISAEGAATACENWNDVYDVAKSGWLDLFIGSKSYLQEAPIGKFAPRCGVGGVAAVSQAGEVADSSIRVDYASFGGPIYELEPNVLLVPTQNFSVTLNWPAAVAISVAGRIGINLGGILYRNSQ